MLLRLLSPLIEKCDNNIQFDCVSALLAAAPPPLDSKQTEDYTTAREAVTKLSGDDLLSLVGFIGSLCTENKISSPVQNRPALNSTAVPSIFSPPAPVTPINQAFSVKKKTRVDPIKSQSTTSFETLSLVLDVDNVVETVLTWAQANHLFEGELSATLRDAYYKQIKVTRDPDCRSQFIHWYASNNMVTPVFKRTPPCPANQHQVE